MATTKINHPDLLDLSSSTGATAFPKGTTGERPVSPEAGYIRFNTTEVVMETYDGTEWLTLDTIIPTYSFDYLVVAGGGGTGYGNNVIGAGAGGMLSASSDLTPLSQYSIIVGAGGTGSGAVTIGNGTNGQNSSIAELSIVSIGGGRSSGNADLNGGNGGSGGGAGKGASAIGIPGTGTIGQGNDGAGNDGDLVGGSGGGAGGLGSSSGSIGNTPGGLGLSNSISGTSVTYASGGGSYDRIGVANTGNGAGNGQGAGGAGGFPGGSGVVILRMPTANYSSTTTGSPTVTTDGTDTILTYTSSGTYTA